MTTANTYSLVRRVSLIGVVSLAAVLLGISGAVSVLLTRVAHERVVSWVGDKAEAVVDAMNAMDDTSRTLVQRSFASFRQEFGPAFTLNEETGELRDCAQSSTTTTPRSTSSRPIPAVWPPCSPPRAMTLCA